MLKQLLLLVVLCEMSAVTAASEPVTSLLIAEPDGWTDLLAGNGLKGWKRVPLYPDTQLNARNPWTLNEGLLQCDGVGIKEMLLFDREFTDGVLHVEWRFRPLEGKQDYNSGIYIRSLDDGRVWHQIQVAHQEKRPLAGDLFGDLPVAGQIERVVVPGEGHQLVHPPGEWNAFDITAAGPVITVSVNGKPALTWDRCEIKQGRVGLQAELYFIEFRSVKYKPAAGSAK